MLGVGPQLGCGNGSAWRGWLIGLVCALILLGGWGGAGAFAQTAGGGFLQNEGTVSGLTPTWEGSASEADRLFGGALGGNGQWASGAPAGGRDAFRLPDLTSRENFSSALQVIILLTVLSLVPSILLMMTCFTRMVIVLALLRQALGTQQLPPNQVLIGLALFMTMVVMGPTIAEINDKALQPYLNGTMSQKDALANATVPVRKFMAAQIEASGNEADVDLFMSFAKLPPAKTWDDVPTMSLIPAFMLSELKTAFLIGFKIYLPFLVIDMVIAAVLISMGMMMLPPVLISLPFKLLLFVLVDGWRLVAGSLMGSFVT
jgi:flagellar biosynthetic protein FliP